MAINQFGVKVVKFISNYNLREKMDDKKYDSNNGLKEFDLYQGSKPVIYFRIPENANPFPKEAFENQVLDELFLNLYSDQRK